MRKGKQATQYNAPNGIERVVVEEEVAEVRNLATTTARLEDSNLAHEVCSEFAVSTALHRDENQLIQLCQYII